MRKNITVLLALLSSGFIFSQVGINTSDPKATLDIVGTTLGIKMREGTGSWDNIWLNVDSRKATVNASGAEDGLQFNVGSNGKGTYGDDDQVLTTVATMTSAGNMGVGTTTPQKTLHVEGSLQITNELNVGGNETTAGSAGTTGQILTSGGPGAAPSWQPVSSTNIYNTDGTLTENRTVTQGANRLAFTGSATNAFSVDGNTFSVDAANNRIGIGTSTPTGKMEIISDNEGSGAGNDIYFRGFGNSVGTGIFLSSARGTAGAPENLQNGDNISGFYFTPRNNNTYATSTSAIQAFYKGDGMTNLTDMRFIASGSERIRIAENGNIGIGTTTPQKKLHIVGSLQITNELNIGGNGSTEGSAGTAGEILTSGGPGAAPSWQPVSSTNVYNTDGTLTGNRTVTQGANRLAFTGTSANAFSVDGNTFSVDAANDRVGIGTATPSAKIDIVGSTLGIKMKEGSGSWDNLWFNVTPDTAFINASGAEKGIQFNVGTNNKGTYGDNDQVLKTVATMTPSGNMGIGTTTPNASAILELSSTSQGFLPPRMTTAQRDSINPRPEGLMIYNTTVNAMQYYNGTTWVSYQ